MRKFKILCGKANLSISPRCRNFQFSTRGERYVFLFLKRNLAPGRVSPRLRVTCFLVADCYFPGSWKMQKDVVVVKVILEKFWLSVFVRKCQQAICLIFIKWCEQNKNDSIVKHKAKVLKLPRASMLILSREDKCRKVTLSTCEAFQELLSKQEEVDTKVIAHAVHTLQQQTIIWVCYHILSCRSVS